MKTKLFGMGILVFALAAAGCDKEKDNRKPEEKKDNKSAKKEEAHEHGPGPHAGAVIEFGKYHGEFCMDHGKKQATVYILDGDAKDAAPIAVEKMVLSIKTPQFQVELKADPQPGDPKGKSSRFTATHDNFAKEQEFEGTVSYELNGKPYQGDFKEEEEKDHKKAAGEVDFHGRPINKSTARETEIFLKPGGSYSLEDIKANGNTTVSEKYKNLKVSHDIKPSAGDKLCPVTLTKSNANLTWIIAGKTYEFCCPPCVEEFVALAKTKPDDVKEPGAYVKK